jgi:hypothetical protein
MVTANKISECDNGELPSPSVGEMRDEDLARMISSDVCENDVCDQDRALSVLTTAVNLFEDLQRGCSLGNRVAHLEEISKLTGVSPPIILYAYKHGILQAHDLFVKEEIKDTAKQPGGCCAGFPTNKFE